MQRRSRLAFNVSAVAVMLLLTLGAVADARETTFTNFVLTSLWEQFIGASTTDANANKRKLCYANSRCHIVSVYNFKYVAFKRRCYCSLRFKCVRSSFKSTNSRISDQSTCNIQISKDLGRISPIFVYPETVLSIRAVNENGDLRFNKGESIQIACPGRDNYVSDVGGRPSEAIAICVGGRVFTIGGEQIKMDKLTCKKVIVDLVLVS